MVLVLGLFFGLAKCKTEDKFTISPLPDVFKTLGYIEQKPSPSKIVCGSYCHLLKDGCDWFSQDGSICTIGTLRKWEQTNQPPTVQDPIYVKKGLNQTDIRVCPVYHEALNATQATSVTSFGECHASCLNDQDCKMYIYEDVTKSCLRSQECLGIQCQTCGKEWLYSRDTSRLKKASRDGWRVDVNGFWNNNQPGFEHWRAIDGIKGDFWNSFVSANAAFSWFQIDIRYVLTQIYGIEILKRHLAWGHPTDFTVRIGNDSVIGHPASAITVNRLCGTYNGDKSFEGLALILCTEILQGQFVTVQTGPVYMEFDEIDVVVPY